jgi:predicted dehydrogenase
MEQSVGRRTFLKLSTAATAGLGLASQATAGAAGSDKPVRVGIIGTGGRGCGLMGVLLGFKGVEVPAVCDVSPGRTSVAQGMVEKAGRPKPEAYVGDEAYKDLLARADVDAVIIATPWELHAPMAVDAMRAGKYAGVEVPCALSLEECWALVDTHEQTGVPCMMLENWSFRRDNLAVLNMIRRGLLGEMVHCHCAHSHDCIDHWFWDRQGNPRWPAKYLINHNRDQYPTHSLGPVLSWMDINCGDAFATLTATATASKGINAHFARKFGPDDPRAKATYAQGDIVTSVVRTHGGKTIVINYDMQLPRPYDNRWMIQGTLGVYDENQESVYLLGRSPQYHKWEPFAPYQDQFDHTWWREFSKSRQSDAGHGGTDFLELQEFVKAVRNRTQTPIDVYDSVVMSVITPLSEMSIAKGSAPVGCPDFTRGKWKSRKPVFAVEV